MTTRSSSSLLSIASRAEFKSVDVGRRDRLRDCDVEGDMEGMRNVSSSAMNMKEDGGGGGSKTS